MQSTTRLRRDGARLQQRAGGQKQLHALLHRHGGVRSQQRAEVAHAPRPQRRHGVQAWRVGGHAVPGPRTLLSAWCLYPRSLARPVQALLGGANLSHDSTGQTVRDTASDNKQRTTQPVITLHRAAAQAGKYTASDAARQDAARKDSARARGKRQRRWKYSLRLKRDRMQHDGTAPVRTRLCLHTSQCIARCAPPGPWRCADCHWYRHSRWMCAEEPRHAHGDSSAPPGLVSSATSQHILPRRALVGRVNGPAGLARPGVTIRRVPRRPCPAACHRRTALQTARDNSSEVSTAVGGSDIHALAAARGAYVSTCKPPLGSRPARGCQRLGLGHQLERLAVGRLLGAPPRAPGATRPRERHDLGAPVLLVKRTRQD